MFVFVVTVGAKFDAQVPTAHPPGAPTGRSHQRAHHRPRPGGIQDFHFPRVRVHRGDSLPEPTRKYTALALVMAIVYLASQISFLFLSFDF